jgi:predicted dehydrogenase
MAGVRRELRLGVIGSGFAARTVVAAAEDCPDVRVAGVTGGHDGAALAAGAGASWFTDLTSMLDHVDAVMVASPHDTHAEYCRQALEAGRHVFCEKPFVLGAEEGRRLVELAERQERVLSVNHFQRYRLPNAAVRDHLGSSGSQVVGGHCRLIEEPMEKGWQLRGSNSGFLFGYGVHAIDLLCWWLRDRVTTVRARAQFDALGVEHTTVATLGFSRGCEIQLLTSDQGVRPGPGSQVGRAVFETRLVTRDGLLTVDSYGAAGVTTDSEHTSLGVLPGWTGFTAPERLAAYTAALGQFARSCLDGVPPEIDPRDMVHGIEVCEALLASAREEGREVCV